MENNIERKSEIKPVMTEDQRELLARMTCAMLELCDDLEQGIEESDVPQEYKDKITKALDMIHEVNQECVEKK